MAIDRPNDIPIVRRWESRRYPDLLPDSLVIPIDEQRPGRIFVRIDIRRRDAPWGRG